MFESREIATRSTGLPKTLAALVSFKWRGMDVIVQVFTRPVQSIYRGCRAVYAVLVPSPPPSQS